MLHYVHYKMQDSDGQVSWDHIHKMDQPKINNK